MEEIDKKYNTLAKKMVKILGLNGSPVAIALKDELPCGLEKGAPERHCEMVQHVRQKGEKFYSTLKEHKCIGGAAVMGLTEIPENVANGEYYYKLGALPQMRLQGTPWSQSPGLKRLPNSHFMRHLNLRIFHRIWSLYCVRQNNPCKLSRRNFI